MIIPMLEDSEWELVAPLFENPVAKIKEYRQAHDISLREAQQRFAQPILDKYRELTGFNETNISAIWHHRVSLYGPLCTSCGKPLRTPKAKFCAACGAARF